MVAAKSSAAKKRSTGGKKAINKKKQLARKKEPESDSESESEALKEESSSDESSEQEPAKTTSKSRSVAQQRRTSESPSSEDESEESSEEEYVKITPKIGPGKQRRETESASTEEGSENDSEQEDSSSDDVSENDDSSSEQSNIETGERGNFFSDENAAWLKPKRDEKAQLMSSSDEEDDQGDIKEDDDELLEVEKQSRLLDAEMEEEKIEAEEELRRTIAQSTAVFHLPSAEEIERDANRVVPPSEIRARIEAILEVLADFKVRREPGRARSEYVDQLASDIAEIHGYLPELIDYFLSMFGPSETVEFVNASDRPRPLVIRTNTLKARRKDLAAALMKRGVTLDPLASWSKVGLKIIESPVPIGATPEYLSGMYMLQSAASMCPVIALSPQPAERVLDMSAAPGGKTSYISQLMRNTGGIVANDLKPERQKATVANMHRLGVRNVIACAHDGRKLGKIFHNRFDRVLLDAPCSGLGVISRDPSVKVQRTLADINRCGHLQKELLLAAIDALNHKSKTGGVLVYSTCSVSVAENEEVVSYALSKRDIKLVETELAFGKPGFTRYQQKRFHPSLALTRRFYPHVHNMDGFYVAKIQKLSDRRPQDKLKEDEPISRDEAEVAEDAQATEETTQEEEVGRTIDGKRTKGGKKRKGVHGEEARKAKKRSQQVSIPPPAKKDEKKRQSAKVTKPRRRNL